MSKERLEEIEGKYSILTIASKRGGIEHTEVEVEDLVFLIQNSFEQGERVQGLEKRLKLYDFWYTVAYQQNKRYREALEEIAYHVATPIGEKEDYEKTVYELIDIAKRALGY